METEKHNYSWGRTGYGIRMQAHNGRNLYLSPDEKKSYGTKIGFSWSFDRGGAAVWDTYEKAEAFAKKYFKNFSDYELCPFTV